MKKLMTQPITTGTMQLNNEKVELSIFRDGQLKRHTFSHVNNMLEFLKTDNQKEQENATFIFREKCY